MLKYVENEMKNNKFIHLLIDTQSLKKIIPLTILDNVNTGHSLFCSGAHLHMVSFN